MKFKSFVVVLALLVLAACGTRRPKPIDPPPPPQPQAPLHVKVADARTRVGIPNARLDISVFLGEDDGRTNADGYFGIMLPIPQGLHVEAFAEGYVNSGRGFDHVGESELHLYLDPVRPPVQPRTGVVRLIGDSFYDDQGHYFADAITLFPAVALVDRYPDVAAKGCEQIRELGINTIRALAVVGGGVINGIDDPWKHLIADPRDPRWPEQIARATDYYYDECGARVGWTLFGGVDRAPTIEEQLHVARTWIAVMQPRLHKVAWVEVSNEMWQTGFGGQDGINRAREVSCLLDRHLPQSFPIAISTTSDTPNDAVTDEMERMFRDSCANLYTPHFSRDVWKADGMYRPVRQPWEWRAPQFTLTGAVNNEPIGPGSSVASERDTGRLVASWLTTKIAKLTGYVFHTDAGVWACRIADAFRGGHADGLRGAFCTVGEEPGAFAALSVIQKLRPFIPPTLHAWNRTRHGFHDHPFARSWDVGQIWPDGDPFGVVRPYCGLEPGGNQFVCLMMGIRDRVELRWDHAMEFTAYSTQTGDPILQVGPDSRALTLRESLGRDIVIVGRYR